MKKQLFSALIIMLVAVICSCDNKEQTVDFVQINGSSSEKAVTDPYQDLSLAIESVNNSYEGNYATRAKWWQYVIGVLGVPFADAFGGASITYNDKDGLGVTISGQNAVKTSVEFWKWMTSDCTQNGTDATPKTTPRRAKGAGSISVTVNTQALPALNGNKLEDNYGFLHNKAIIDLYGLYGDNLKDMPYDDFSSVLAEKITSIIQEYELISCDSMDENSDYTSQIATICYENDNISDIITSCKMLNPSLSREYDIIAIAFGELIANCFPEEIVYQYTQEISTVVDQSLLSDDSKRMIKASVSIFGASSQLWKVTEN